MLKTPLVAAVTALVVVILGFVLNPSAERHRAEIREAVAERSEIEGMLGVGALKAFVSTYHGLGVASYTTIDGKVVTVGAFGMVFVLEP